MITEIREIYKCQFCRKLYQKRKYAEKHECQCLKNPANDRPCLDGCQHFTQKTTTAFYGYYDGGQEEVNVFYCKKKEIFIHPPVNDQKNNVYDLGDECNEKMPLECSDFKTCY